jgi:hypothetical protein
LQALQLRVEKRNRSLWECAQKLSVKGDQWNPKVRGQRDVLAVVGRTARLPREFQHAE